MDKKHVFDGSGESTQNVQDSEVALAVLQHFLQRKLERPVTDPELMQCYREVSAQYGKPLTMTQLEQFLDDEAQMEALRHTKPDMIDKTLDRMRNALRRFFDALPFVHHEKTPPAASAERGSI